MTLHEPKPARDLSISLGICASVALHVFTGFALLAIFVRDFDALGIHLPPLRGNQAGQNELVVVAAEKNSEFGETDGRGNAINASPGDEILRAREATQDQAWLSRDPIGPGKKMLDEPSFSTALPGNNGDGREKLISAALPPAPLFLLQELEQPTPFGPSTPPAPAVPMLVAKLPAVKLEILPAESVERPVVEKPSEKIAERPAQKGSDKPSEKLVEKFPGEEALKPADKVAEKPAEKSVEGLVKEPVKEPVEKPVEKPEPKPVTVAALVSTSPPVDKPVPPTQASSPKPNAISTPSKPAPASGQGAPGPNVPPADAAPQSESESDPFARIGSISFGGNKVEAKIGRKFRSFKPRLNLKAQLDLVSLSNPRLLLKIKIDETGKVTDAFILKSSGSNEIDLPTQVAMYKWWFEPATGKDGKPRPDVIVLAISYM